MAPLILPGQTTQQPQYPAPLLPAYANDVTLSVNFAGGSRNSVTDQTATGVYTEAVNAQGKAYKNVNAAGSLSWPVKGVTGTDKWTLLFHFYLPVYDTNARGVLQIASNASATSANPFLLLQSNGAGALALFVEGNYRITAANVFASGTNHALAVTYDGATLTLIRNGAVLGTYASANIGANTSDTLWVGSGYPTPCDIEVLALNYVNSATPVAQLQSLTAQENLWQIFIAQPRRIWLPGATVQILRPASDISAGAWTPSTGINLYAMLNETVADDANYITTPTPSTCEVKLSLGVDPVSSINHLPAIRCRGTSGTITVNLMQGATIKATFVLTVTPAFTTFTPTLTTVEIDSISDYGDLRYRFTSAL